MAIEYENLILGHALHKTGKKWSKVNYLPYSKFTEGIFQEALIMSADSFG